jgi:hypothetical protein
MILLVVLAGGCDDWPDDPPVGGGPAGDLLQADGSDDPEDLSGYVSPRRDGMDEVVDLSNGQSAQQPDLAGRPAVDDTVCNNCEAAQCRNVDGNDWYAYCFLNMDPVTTGPGSGSKFSDLCLAVLKCARMTGCDAVDPEACYCGAGVSDLTCLGNPQGPCINEFEAAAESTHVDEVIDRLSDPSYPVGAAFNLLRYCEVPICGSSCTGPIPDGGLPDLSVKPMDLSTSQPDLSSKVDLSTPPDLSKPADLSHAPDLSHPIDLGTVPCADLDNDGKPDCNVTLVKNSRFDTDTSQWTAEYGATEAWLPGPDALGSLSGSIAVTNTTVVTAMGTTMAGAEQCVSAIASASYRIAAQTFIPTGQGSGVADIAVQLFPSSDCSGAASGAWSSAVTSATGAWDTLSGSFVAPTGAKSMRVRLTAVKMFSAPAFTAQFDNVLLETP